MADFHSLAAQHARIQNIFKWKAPEKVNMMKKKVLLITDCHHKAGGAETYFFALKDELKKEKEFAAFSLGFSNKNEEGEDYKTIKQSKSLILRHFWRLFFNPIKYFQIKSYIKKINPDVIHIHNINKYTISLLMAIRKNKVIQTVHDFSLICPNLWNIHSDNSPCKTGAKLSCIWKHKRN